MLSRIEPLAVGNALRVFFEPPAGALQVRLLRKVSDTFSGHDDAQARLVFAGDPVNSVVDSSNLQNGTTYFYRAYYLIGTAWSASASVSEAPNATYADASTDVLEVVRDRLQKGMRVEVDRGNFASDADDKYIKVLNAPPQEETTRWPVITVHLTNESPGYRAVGEMVEADDFLELDGTWGSGEGWLAKVQLSIIGWCLNPDERIDLRKALRRLIVANLPVFDEHGMVEIEFSQQDIDSVSGEFAAPVYQVMNTLTCVAPVRVLNGPDQAIRDVQTSLIEG